MSDLPGNWEAATLNDAAEIIRGLAFPSVDKRLESGASLIACLRTANVQENVKWDDLWFIPRKYVRNERQLIRLGDILISTANSYELVGKVALVRDLPTEATLGAFISLIRFWSPMNPSYAYYQLASSETQQKIRELASTTVNISNVSTGKLGELKLRIAPRPEQDRIVAEIEKQLTRLDDAVTALKRVQANLKRYRASVLKAACEGRLVPTEAELARKEGRDYEPASELLKRILAERRNKWEADQLQKMIAAGKPPKNDEWKKKYVEPSGPEQSALPSLAEGWTWVRAEQVCDFITKGTTPAAHKLHAQSGEVPYIKVYNLTDEGRLDFSYKPTFIDRSTHNGELARSKVYPADVLMNIVGPPLGKVSIVPDTYPDWNINQAIAIFRPFPGLSSRFLCHILLTETILAWAIRRAKATAGQFNLTLELCRDLPLPLAPEEEQSRIEEELSRRVSGTEAIQATLDTNSRRAHSLRQSVLSAAFLGKLVPQDPDDEPASVVLERIRAERANAQTRKEKNQRKGHDASPRNGQRRRRVASLARVSAGKG